MKQEFVVYILYSVKNKKTYVGITNNLIERFKSHNERGHGWTQKYRPWIVVWVEFFQDKEKARKKERYFKSGSGHYAKIKIIHDFLQTSGSYSSDS
ncbi:MAG: GIY-YIG nuclease family protein [Bacteroidales bacterium]|nr:GIY-YIG nuclease family protein [Bacteroidales bacterium]NSW45375.1 GIY-YIG nuclease family protein [Bacteroidales bacterium]